MCKIECQFDWMSKMIKYAWVPGIALLLLLGVTFLNDEKLLGLNKTYDTSNWERLDSFKTQMDNMQTQFSQLYDSKPNSNLPLFATPGLNQEINQNQEVYNHAAQMSNDDFYFDQDSNQENYPNQAQVAPVDARIQIQQIQSQPYSVTGDPQHGPLMKITAQQSAPYGYDQINDRPLLQQPNMYQAGWNTNAGQYPDTNQRAPALDYNYAKEIEEPDVFDAYKKALADLEAFQEAAKDSLVGLPAENIQENLEVIAEIETVESEREDVSETVLAAEDAIYGSEVYRSSVKDLLPQLPPMDAPPINTKFLFHNKLPKSGSTTMKWLLVELQKKNNFKLDHQKFCIKKANCFSDKTDDGPGGKIEFANYIKNQLPTIEKQNYVLLKHHHWFNFTKFDLPTPTYINVARDPVSRFASRYYFQRFGWERDDGKARTNFNGNKETKQRTLDECVSEDLSECTDALQVMVKYFCGLEDACTKHYTGDVRNNKKALNWERVAISTEIAKKHIIKDFYAVGVLEHFDETVKLFEKLLPEYFTDAFNTYNTPEVQAQRSSSKSIHPAKYTNKTRLILETGVLRYEMDIYNLIKAIFFKKLQYHKIPLPVF